MAPGFSSVLITGASSGIGAALAQRYAGPGMTLALQGRDALRLDAVADACRARGAMVHSALIDVTDRERIGQWVGQSDNATPLDLVIANAGISGGTSGLDRNEKQARHIFAVNFDGVVNTAYPAIDCMRRRGHGTVALMSSLASFRGMSAAPAYGASKAAVRLLGEALRGTLRAEGIDIAVICPGFVTTPMTATNKFSMPFLMNADRAAGIIERGLARGKARIAFPWPMLAAVLAVTALPIDWVDRWLLKLPPKGS